MWANDLTTIVIFVWWIMPLRIKCCYTEDFYLQVLLQVLSHCLQSMVYCHFVPVC